MGFLAVALTFTGYLLVYAATANHGAFATSPWTGVLADAYDAGNLGAPAGPQGPGGLH